MPTRIYLSLTNNCNLKCPFCCMHSAPGKRTYLSVWRFKEILYTCKDTFELQLEGGEPLLHPAFEEFIRIALDTLRCTKIIICTNGILLPGKIDWLDQIARKVHMVIKPSVNSHVITHHSNCIDSIRRLVSSYPKIGFVLNVRIGNRLTKKLAAAEDLMLEHLAKTGLINISNVFKLQRYGRSSGNSQLELPYINQNIQNWEIFASDGRSFGHDLIARSEYEETLK